MRLSNAAAITALNAVAALPDNGEIKVYTGSEPDTVETAATGTLLGTNTLASDAFPAGSDGGGLATTAANAIGDDVDADADGDPGYFRILDSGGTAILQGSAGGPSNPTRDLVFDKDTFVAGDVVKINSLTLRMPEA